MPELDILVSVLPRSSRQSIEEIDEHKLRVKLKAAPTGGQANKELVELLAKHYDVGKTSVEIIKGLTSKLKTVRIYLP